MTACVCFGFCSAPVPELPEMTVRRACESHGTLLSPTASSALCTIALRKKQL